MDDAAYSYGKITVRKIIKKEQKNKEGKCEISIEIFNRTVDSNLKVSRKYKRISTGFKVLPAHWLEVKREVSKKDPEYSEKNFSINDLYNRLFKYTNDLDNQDYRQEIEAEFKTLANFFPPARKMRIKGIIEYLDFNIGLN